MIVMAPADAAELPLMLDLAVRAGKPVAIRYPRTTIVDSVAGVAPAPVEIGKSALLREGRDATILAYGVTAAAALDAAEALHEEGIEVTVINARFAKPLDGEAILAAARRGPIVTVEEHVLAGGFGSAVLELLSREGVCGQVSSLGIPDRFVEHGARARLLASLSLDAPGIASAVKDALRQARSGGRGAERGKTR
jgi:1-deoxy-D-xylulose-5-phosphate synthase